MSDEQGKTDAMVEPGEFLRLFACDVAAWGRPTGERKNGKEVWDYKGLHRKPEAQDAERHFRGEVSIVANPIFQHPGFKEDCPAVKWVGIDSDNYDPIFQASLRDKVSQLMPFAMVVPSKSGGLHVFVLFERAVPFAQSKVLLDGWVALLGLSPKTEIFPSQPWAKADKGLGINLPGFGTGLRRDAIKKFAVEPRQFVPASSSSDRTASDGGDTKSRRPTADGFDLGEFLDFYGIKFQKRGEVYGLDACPLCDGGPRPHTQHNDSTTVIWCDGKGMGAKCQADSHRELGATDMVDVLLASRPWDKPVWKSRSYPKTESGNAERFADTHRGEFFWDKENKVWYHYDGRRWTKEGLAPVHLAAKAIARKIYKEALEIKDDEHRKKLIGWAMQSESQKGRNAIVNLAVHEDGMSKSLLEFDADFDLLNVANGTLELRPLGGGMAKFREHRPGDFITRMANAVYDPKADCPRFKQFLMEISEHLKDEARAEFIHSLQRAAGYTLIGGNFLRKYFQLWGCGSNGKGLFETALAYVLGDYAVTTSFSVFLMKVGGDKGIDPRSGLAGLAGSRMVLASEAPQGATYNESLLKTITGGVDLIRVAQIYEKDFQYLPGYKIWLGTNHRPHMRGTDDGIWDRLQEYVFGTRIPDEKKDDQLYKKFAAEASGILNWQLEGLMLLLHKYPWVKGLKSPQDSMKAMEDYRAGENIVRRFWDDVCRPSELGTRASFVYQAFQKWCKLKGEKFVPSNRSFKDEMEKLCDYFEFTSGKYKKHNGYKLEVDLNAMQEMDFDSNDQ